MSLVRNEGLETNTVSKLQRFGTVFSEVDSIIRSIRSYPKRRRTQRLYKQWAETSGLQAEVSSAGAVKTKDASLQVVTASSFSTRLSDYGEGSTQDSEPKDTLDEDPTPKQMTDRIHNTKGANAGSDSYIETRKVAMFMMAEINKEQLRLVILLVLLGASIIIFCLGVILVILHSFGLGCPTVQALGGASLTLAGRQEGENEGILLKLGVIEGKRATQEMASKEAGGYVLTAGLPAQAFKNMLRRPNLYALPELI